MKRLLLLLLCFLLSSVVYSQTLVHSYAVRVGAWSERIDDWIYQDWVYTEHEILLKGYYVYVNDKKESTYKTYGDAMVLDQFVVWNAYDENGDECVFSMNDDYIIITYIGDFTIAYATRD